MATRNVVLTDAQSAFVDRLVASGRYQNASEALRAGLRLLEREEAEMDVLRRDTIKAWEEFRTTGLSVPAEEVDRWLSNWGTEDESPAPQPRA